MMEEQQQQQQQQMMEEQLSPKSEEVSTPMEEEPEMSGAVSASTSPNEACTSPLSMASEMPVRSSPVTDFEIEHPHMELFGEAALLPPQNDDLFYYYGKKTHEFSYNIFKAKSLGFGLKNVVRKIVFVQVLIFL